jgi:sphingolipid 4-desaturase/C4-monooxygenase
MSATSSSLYRHALDPSSFPFDLSAGAETVPPSYSTSTASSSSSPSASASDDEHEQPAQGQGQGQRLAGEEWAPEKVVPEQSHDDFLWMMTEEPHRTRRKAILKAHPEVRAVVYSLSRAEDLGLAAEWSMAYSPLRAHRSAN